MIKKAYILEVIFWYNRSMARIKITLDGFRCDRCGHEWVVRDKQARDSNQEPNVCPSCKSPYWNKPRKNNVPTGAPPQSK